MKLFGLFVVVLALVSTAASAAIIEDFESYNIGDPFQGGTIVADPDNPGNKVLSLEYGASHTYATVAIPGAPVAGIASMDIYDYGKTGGSYGPRWGVGGDIYYAAAYIREGAGVNSSHGYGMTWDTQPASAWSRTGSWFSAKFFGGPRLVDQLFVPGDPLAEPPVPDTLADGDWSTWTFTSGGGVCDIDNGTVSNVTAYDVGALTDVWFWSGKNATNAGVLVDNIAFDVPEPATMSLLALGALALIRRRR